MVKTPHLKKIIAVMCLSLITVFGLTACGDDPVDVFNTASDNMSKAEDVSFKGNLSAKVDMGTSMDVDVDMEGIYKKSKTKNPLDCEACITANTKMMGQETKMNVWMKDKKIYTEADGLKTVQDLTENPSTAEMIEQFGGKALTKIDKDFVTGSEEDGDAITLKLNTLKFVNRIISKNIKDAEMKKQIDAYMKKVEMKDTVIKAIIEDENFAKLNISAAVRFDMGDLAALSQSSEKSTKAEISADITMEEFKPNTGKAIDWPNFTEFQKAGEAEGEFVPADGVTVTTPDEK